MGGFPDGFAGAFFLIRSVFDPLAFNAGRACEGFFALIGRAARAVVVENAAETPGVRRANWDVRDPDGRARHFQHPEDAIVDCCVVGVTSLEQQEMMVMERGLTLQIFDPGTLKCGRISKKVSRDILSTTLSLHVYKTTTLYLHNSIFDFQSPEKEIIWQPPQKGPLGSPSKCKNPPPTPSISGYYSPKIPTLCNSARPRSSKKSSRPRREMARRR
jgi:hypothetical protein